jgi:hypothetical protein
MHRGKFTKDWDNVVSQFHNLVYNGLENLAETIMNTANCNSSRVNVSVKDNSDFDLPEPVYVYTNIIKPNLVGVLTLDL